MTLTKLVGSFATIAFMNAHVVALATETSPAAQNESTVATTDGATIAAKVNGLVCDFCAQALRKVFMKEAGVDDITVDLDAGEVVIALKPDATLEDARVKKLIRKSGYSLVSIKRSGGA